MIAAAAGYILSEIKKTKGAKKAAKELSTATWEWIRPLFLKDDKKLVEKIENAEDPEKYRGAIELAIEKIAEKNPNFAKKLVAWTQDAKEKEANSISINGDNNQVNQNVINSQINTTKIDRQINQGDNSTYNEYK